MRRLSFWLLGFLLIIDLSVGTCVLLSDPGENDDAEVGKRLSTFTRAIRLIEQDFVDPAKANFKSLIRGGLHGMLTRLDPHTFYLEASNYAESQEESRGEVTGVGIVISTINSVITVVSSVEESPAAAAGIAPGDQVQAINGVNVERKSLEAVSPLLRGALGSKVKLKLYRPSDKSGFEVDLTRQIYRINTVKDAGLLDPTQAGSRKIGYLRITEFNQQTGVETAEKVENLLAAGMQALIIDLRFNPGGLVQSAIDTCGVFLPPKTMVVYTEGRDAANHQEFFTSPRSKALTGFPIALLVNAGSASAAEIVAGAMKDAKRAMIVGETTFGKGLVQAQFPLPDGSGIHLTVARYYTPNHETIQERGVSPDILSVMSRDDDRALLLRRRGTFLSLSEKEFVEKAKDNQLSRAVDALKAYLIWSKPEPS